MMYAKTTTPEIDNILEIKRTVAKHFGEDWRVLLNNAHGEKVILASLLDPKMTKETFLSTWYPKHF